MRGESRFPDTLWQSVARRHILVEIKLQSRLAWRMLGIGLPGYYQGWFSGRRRKKDFRVVTRRRPRVYLPMSRSSDLMLTQDDPYRFLKALTDGTGPSGDGNPHRQLVDP